MRKKKIQTGLAFVLIAFVIAVTAVALIHSKSAQSEESADGTYDPNTGAAPDPGPYGLTPEEIAEMQAHDDPFGFSNHEPLVKLKDLPPLPPPFGPGKRVLPDGTIQTSDDLSNLSPELRAKIEQLKARKAPWDASNEEGR